MAEKIETIMKTLWLVVVVVVVICFELSDGGPMFLKGLKSVTTPTATCRKAIIGHELSIDDLPGPIDERIFVPFYIKFNKLLTKNNPYLMIRFGTGEDQSFTTNPSYFVKIIMGSTITSSNNNMRFQIGKSVESEGDDDVEEDYDKVLESLDLYNEPRIRHGYVGYYIRLKIREDYSAVAIYEAGADAKEAILSLKDEDDPIAKISTYGFTTGGSANVSVKFDCLSYLGSECVHTVDCRKIEGGICTKQSVGAGCSCSDEYLQDGRGGCKFESHGTRRNLCNVQGLRQSRGKM